MFRRSDVEVKKERIPQLAFASLLIFVMGAGAVFMRLLMGVWPSILQLRGLEGVGLLLTFLLVWLFKPRPERLEVVASDKTIQVGSEVFPLFALRALRLKKDKDGSRVRIVKTWWSPDIDLVMSEEDAAELMTAAGADVGHKVAALGISSPLRDWALLLQLLPIAAVAALMSTHHRNLLIPGIIAAFLPMVILMFPAKLHVGADGILRRWLGMRKFVKLADIRSVVEEKRSVLLGLADGKQWRIPTVEPGTIAATIRQALETHGPSHAGAELASLERGTRTIKEWLVRLKQLGEGANATLRTAPLSPDGLWAIIEDASADAHARVAATIALRSTGSFDKKRVDDAAQAIASPKLRVALETCAASEDETAYEKALAEVE